MNRFAFSLAAGLLGCLSAYGAHAVTVFTDRAAWEAAVAASPLYGGTIVNDPFANDMSSALSITFDSGVVSTLSDSVGLAFGDNRIQGGEYTGAVDGNNSDASVSTLWQFPAGIFAFGVDWLLTNPDGLQLTANYDGAGDQTIAVNLTISASDGFLGLLGTAPFSSVTLSNPTTVTDVFFADNLAFAPVAAVPEPATMTMLGAGLLGLWLRRRKD